MSALRDWECAAHGFFEARTRTAQTVPRCPKGCSSAFVKLVYLQPVGTVSAKTRRGDKLVREMADMQGLSDISTSPSRPGGSVAQRNRMRGPKGFEYPAQLAANAAGGVLKLAGADGGNGVKNWAAAMAEKDNSLTNIGFGHKYDASEWTTNKETGNVTHTGAQGPRTQIPTGSTGVSIDRVKERQPA